MIFARKDDKLRLLITGGEFLAKTGKNDSDDLQKIIEEKNLQIEQLENLLKAYSKVEKMTNSELLDAATKLKNQERMTDFSTRELKQKEIALAHVLEVNKLISSIMEPEKLLDAILESLVKTLKAERGVLYVIEQEFLIAKTFENFSVDEFRKEYFHYCQYNIDHVVKTRKSTFKLFQEIDDGDGPITLSLVCLPLVYDDKLIGLIYVDIVSDKKTFRIQDLDIAEIFSSQAAISLNNATLYQKIRSQNLELMKLLNLKDQMINEVSKKIQKPLSQLNVTIKKILDDEETAGWKHRKEIDLVNLIVDQMHSTVDKVVTIQELEKEIDDLFSDVIDFKELFDFIIEYYHDEIARRNIDIRVDVPEDFPGYHGNLTIMRTIFDELISNSIMYNKQNGTVNIGASRKGDYVVIEIEDTGYGIKEDDIENIFQQFYRTENSADMNDKGAGLGLYLVRKFIKYYNGDVQVKSVYGEGSTFTAKLMAN